MSVDDLVKVDGEYATIVEIKGSEVTVRFCDGSTETCRKSEIKEL
jgi:hypothetical protein